MEYLIVDDEKLILKDEERTLRSLLGDDDSVRLCDNYLDAIEIVEETKPYVAFLDVDMPEMNGLEICKRIEEISPDTNIVFVTGYQKYGIDAWDTSASAFLLKPATKEDFRHALSMLRKPKEKKILNNELEMHCFGNFEIFFQGKPVEFSRRQSKELLAYLVDRHGAAVTNAELRTILWSMESDSDSKKSYVRTLASDIRKTFKKLGIRDIFISKHGVYYVDVNTFKCDLYDYENGLLDREVFHGEYMSQYGWAEVTQAQLNSRF